MTPAISNYPETGETWVEPASTLVFRRPQVVAPTYEIEWVVVDDAAIMKFILGYGCSRNPTVLLAALLCRAKKFQK